MAKPAVPTSNVRLHSRGTKAQTRELLIRATLELLHSGGEDAVTTVSVTRATGVVQSMFYHHFVNVEECLAVAAERTAGHIREAVAEARRAMYLAGGQGRELEQFYRDVFGLASAQRPTVELFLRHRTDPLALGGVMHRLAADLRSDLARDMTEQAGRAGLPTLPTGWVEAVADHLMGASWSALEAWLTGRGLGIEESARVLAAFTTGACLGVIEAAAPRLTAP